MSELEPIQKLATAFARLPGVGRKSAARMAHRVARAPGTLAADMQSAIQEVREHIVICEQCGSLTTKEYHPCTLCSDPSRDSALLCVVEDAADILMIEQAGVFRGSYHALLGKLSPLKGEGLRNPRLVQLFDRVKEGGVREIILALNSDVESDATASFLQEQLEDYNVKVTHLAFGIPVGSGIAYSDPITLARALQGRQEYEG